MQFEFGDLFDARNDPLGHFFVVVGTIPQKGTEKERVLFYRLSSKVYKVFRKILDFFNYCVSNNYPPFFHHFSKEKKKSQISQLGNLCDAFFIDQNDYSGQLDEDSYILLNEDPEESDADALNARIQEKIIKYSTKLSAADMYKLVAAFHCCNRISRNTKKRVNIAYDQHIKQFKKT